MPSQKPRPEPARSSAHEFEPIRKRNKARNETANLITVVMLFLTLLVLAWVAYQLNHPIDLYLPLR